MIWSISLFIFKFYGQALLSSTEDAGAEAYVFALPVGRRLLFFPFFVRALILSRLTRVMGNVYVFSRIKTAFSGALWLRFRDGVVELPAPPPC